MKKIHIIISLLFVVIMLLTLSACGNMSYGLGNYEFTKIHVDTYHYSGCLDVVKWYENSTGVEVKTSNGNIFLSEGTYMMIEDDCPFCGGVEND